MSQLPTPVELYRLHSDLTLQVTGLTDSVKAYIAALEFKAQKDQFYPAASPGLDRQLQAHSKPSKLGIVQADNGGSIKRYLQVHDAHVAPQEGSAPRLIVPLNPDSTVSEDFTGLRFSMGIYICISTTATTKTLLQSDECSLFCNFQYD